MTLTSPTEQQIYDQVRHAVADILRLPVDRITKDARLGEDLGMESIDYVDLQFRLESEFGIQLYPGSAADRLRERVHLSLAHTTSSANAQVVLES